MSPSCFSHLLLLPLSLLCSCLFLLPFFSSSLSPSRPPAAPSLSPPTSSSPASSVSLSRSSPSPPSLSCCYLIFLLGGALTAASTPPWAGVCGWWWREYSQGQDREVVGGGGTRPQLPAALGPRGRGWPGHLGPKSWQFPSSAEGGRGGPLRWSWESPRVSPRSGPLALKDPGSPSSQGPRCEPAQRLQPPAGCITQASTRGSLNPARGSPGRPECGVGR